MTEKQIKLILRLAPEQLIETDYSSWCGAMYEKKRRVCFRTVGHTGPHVTGQGCTLLRDKITIRESIYKIIVWHDDPSS